MKTQVALLTVILTLACCSVSKADISNAAWHDDGDGKIVCNTWGWTSGTSTLWMYGNQYGLPAQPGPGLPGHMLGTIDTTTELDPTLFLGSAVDNDTGAAWIGYKVNVVMNQSFTFQGTPTVDNPAPDSPPTDNWFLAGTVAPTLQVSGPYAGLYEGTIDFSAGTPVGIGDELDFNYAIHFLGSTHYAFTQEMIPIFAEVPEPSTLALAGMGGLALALRLRRNGRKAA